MQNNGRWEKIVWKGGSTVQQHNGAKQNVWWSPITCQRWKTGVRDTRHNGCFLEFERSIKNSYRIHNASKIVRVVGARIRTEPRMHDTPLFSLPLSLPRHMLSSFTPLPVNARLRICLKKKKTAPAAGSPPGRDLRELLSCLLQVFECRIPNTYRGEITRLSVYVPLSLSTSLPLSLSLSVVSKTAALQMESCAVLSPCPCPSPCRRRALLAFTHLHKSPQHAGNMPGLICNGRRQRLKGVFPPDRRGKTTSTNPARSTRAATTAAAMTVLPFVQQQEQRVRHDGQHVTRRAAALRLVRRGQGGGRGRGRGQEAGTGRGGCCLSPSPSLVRAAAAVTAVAPAAPTTPLDPDNLEVRFGPLNRLQDHAVPGLSQRVLGGVDGVERGQEVLHGGREEREQRGHELRHGLGVAEPPPTVADGDSSGSCAFTVAFFSAVAAATRAQAFLWAVLFLWRYAAGQLKNLVHPRRNLFREGGHGRRNTGNMYLYDTGSSTQFNTVCTKQLKREGCSLNGSGRRRADAQTHTR